jgi:hypothetical protein
MKHFLVILFFALCATGYAQTIKSLGYNTTNGRVVYSGTNALTFTNALAFSNAATTRTNLGLGLPALTNTSASNLVAAIGLGPTNNVQFNSVSVSNAAASRTNLGLSLAALTNTTTNALRAAIGAAPKAIFLVTTNNKIITNNTNFVGVEGLSFNTEANKKYLVALNLFVQNVGGATSVLVEAINASAFGRWNTASGPSSTAVTNEASIAATGNSRAPFNIFYVVAGTNAGTIAIKMASPNTNSTNTIETNSWLKAEEVE